MTGDRGRTLTTTDSDRCNSRLRHRKKNNDINFCRAGGHWVIDFMAHKRKASLRQSDAWERDGL